MAKQLKSLQDVQSYLGAAKEAAGISLPNRVRQEEVKIKEIKAKIKKLEKMKSVKDYIKLTKELRRRSILNHGRKLSPKWKG